MEVQLINEELLDRLHKQAMESERLRQNFDLRTTAEDGSQRMLNALEVGTRVPIQTCRGAVTSDKKCVKLGNRRGGTSLNSRHT